MKRELSLEERLNLLTAIERLTMPNIKAHTVETISRGSTEDLTIVELHTRLDNRFVPRFTNCPYPLVCLADAERQGKRLDMAFIDTSGALITSSDPIQSTLFRMALDGELSRARSSEEHRHQVTYMFTEDNVSVRNGDCMLRVGREHKVYVLLVSDEMRERANKQSEGSV